MLHCSIEDIKFILELTTSSLLSIKNSLNESVVPKAIIRPGSGIHSIEKCSWILLIATMVKLSSSHFQSLMQSLTVLLEIKYPMLISVLSKHACYQHMVVVWREMFVNYECMYMLVPKRANSRYR